MIGTISSCDQKMIELKKYQAKFPLFPLLGVNIRLPLLHMSNIYIYININIL